LDGHSGIVIIEPGACDGFFAKVISEIKNGLATDGMNKVSYGIRRNGVTEGGILKGRGVGIPPFLTPKP
jgi:hypothetical protein